MIKLIIFLITGNWCNHKWKTDREVNVYEGTTPMDGRLPTRVERVCTCTKCVKPKTFNL